MVKHALANNLLLLFSRESLDQSISSFLPCIAIVDFKLELVNGLFLVFLMLDETLYLLVEGEDVLLEP